MSHRITPPEPPKKPKQFKLVCARCGAKIESNSAMQVVGRWTTHRSVCP